MRLLLAIIIVGLLAFVFWRGWLQFNVSNTGDQTNTTLTVNKDKIQQDVDNLKNREHAVTSETPAPERTAPAVVETTVRGRVENAATNAISLLTADGQTVHITLTPTTTITIAGRVSRSTDIKAGDAATAVQVMTNTGPVASSIAVDPR